MARVVLITGGNLGDVKSRLRTAQRMINDKVGIVLRCSHRYKSRPWGFKADDEFSNQVLEVDTDLSADEVLDAVQAIERELGRDREEEARLKAEEEKREAKHAGQMNLILTVISVLSVFSALVDMHEFMNRIDAVCAEDAEEGDSLPLHQRANAFLHRLLLLFSHYTTLFPQLQEVRY